MSRLGIVVAVSENAPPTNSLKACAKDGAAFESVLRASGRFDDILVLGSPDDTKSRTAKAKLSAFVDRHKGNAVEEVVFFFSGHGVFTGDEFYHVLSDYESARASQTALGNGELDGMLRSLNPELCVKIVDACFSGTSYVKSDDELGDYLKSAKAGFNNVYFLYSSQADEKSFTSGELSAFTKSLLEAMARESQGAIRYGDLVNAARDAFGTGARQRPQFVIQAPFTDVFVEASPHMQATIEGFLPKKAAPPPTPAPAPNKQPDKSLSLVEQVKAADERYCTREEAEASLAKFAQKLKAAEPGAEVAELFRIVTTVSADAVDGAQAVGEWLEKQAGSGYFADPTTKRVSYKKRVLKRRAGTGLLSMTQLWRTAGLASDEDTELVDAFRVVVTGYTSTASLPFASATLRLEPRFKALAPLDCTVAVVVSRTTATVFWSTKHYRYSDWETTVAESTVATWSDAKVALKDEAAMAGLAERIIQELMTSAMQRVATRFPSADAEDAKPAASPSA